MRKQDVRFVLGLVLAGFFWGCATTVQDPSDLPPWAQMIPPSDTEEVLLVGYGVGETRGAATQAAYRDIEDQILQILIARFDPLARGLTDQQGEALLLVSQERRHHLLRQDSFRALRSDGSHERFLLLLYEKDDIASDLDRIDAVLAEATAAVSAPRQDKDQQGAREEEPSRETGALEAVEALLKGPIPSSREERVGRLEEALSAAARLTLTATPGEVRTALGQPLEQPLLVRLSDQGAQKDLPGVPLAVVLQDPPLEGRQARHRASVTTGSSGVGSFRIPEPSLAGLSRIVFRPEEAGIALERWREALEEEELPGEDRPELILLQALEERLSAEVRLRIDSGAAEIPTAVIMIDRDIAGLPIPSRESTRGAIQHFQEEGFTLVPADISPATVRALSDLSRVTIADLYDLLPFELLSSAERIVLGTASILRFDESEGVTVVISLEAAAFDLRRDQELARIHLEERVSGRDARNTLRSAFLSAGRRAARQLAPRLP
ncbi:hypothetical protein SAMN05920897_11059 [Alkalispirochaeta americana]|uniref:LPP20 lipoprotein n=2 Tax=Alkalispirochaeta americana TaxID=159291 RepID=A0A1N6THW3_9SPIO|nr:hypothetical protein SAMN05920897_11059 [Alkalispirochaeta americana]